MKNGQCPKCNSATVYSKTSGVFFYYNVINVRTSQIDRAIPFVSFICTTCGYYENFITDPNKLAEVTKTWQKVPTGGSA